MFGNLFDQTILSRFSRFFLKNMVGIFLWRFLWTLACFKLDPNQATNKNQFDVSIWNLNKQRSEQTTFGHLPFSNFQRFGRRVWRWQTTEFFFGEKIKFALIEMSLKFGKFGKTRCVHWNDFNEIKLKASIQGYGRGFLFGNTLFDLRRCEECPVAKLARRLLLACSTREQ